MSGRLVVVCAICMACGRIGFDPSTSPSDGNPDGPFSAPVRSDLSSASNDSDPKITADLLAFYLQRDSRIHVARRMSAAEEFGPFTELVELPEASGGILQDDPVPSVDDLELFYRDTDQIHRAIRNQRDDLWSPQGPEPGLDLPGTEDAPTWLSVDGRRLYMQARTAEGLGIWFATRDDLGEWSTPTLIEELDSPVDEAGAFLSPDENTLYFHSDRTGTVGGRDLWESRLGALGWGTPVLFEGLGLNTTFDEADIWMTPDQRTVFFATDRDGNFDIYQATR